MLNILEVHETNQMIEQEKLDVRTITMGIDLMDCVSTDLQTTCDLIYNKITSYAEEPRVHRRVNRTRLRHSDCEQAHHGHADRARRRQLLQDLRRLRADRPRT